MIRPCGPEDFEAIYAIINTAAGAYEGVIPPDRWKVPYMSRQELEREMAEGVTFWGYEEEGELWGVMGIQHMDEVTLIRHAYVRPERQRQGIGGALLAHLRPRGRGPLLVGTWAAASWAIRFYEHHGFVVVGEREKNRLLRRYWSIPERQVETSVVLVEESRRP